MHGAGEHLQIVTQEVHNQMHVQQDGAAAEEGAQVEGATDTEFVEGQTVVQEGQTIIMDPSDPGVPGVPEAKKIVLNHDPVIQTIGNQSYTIIPVDGKNGGKHIQVQQIPI